MLLRGPIVTISLHLISQAPVYIRLEGLTLAAGRFSNLDKPQENIDMLIECSG